MSVDQEKVNRLKSRIKEEFPDYEVVYKTEGEKWHSNWMIRIVQLFINLVGLVAPSFKDKFYNGVANGFGRFILLPDKERWKDWSNQSVYGVIRHEFVHMRDYKRSPPLFVLTYILFPLPTIVSGRAYWELRAYTQNMIVEYEEEGKISEGKVKWICSQFTSSLYFWMFPFRGTIERKVQSLKEKIEKGEIRGMYPELDLL